MLLRDYQVQCVNSAREILFKQNKRSVVLQSPTGSGKTAIVSEIISRVCQNKKRAWFVVPRKELVKQSSESLTKWQVPHGKIDASNRESCAYKAHIISLQTLMRRLDRIKEWPEIIFFDESHLNFTAQLKIMRYTDCVFCEKTFYEKGVRMCGEQETPCQKVKECEKWKV
jgi:superfamily II DNA or RNA helicase